MSPRFPVVCGLSTKADQAAIRRIDRSDHPHPWTGQDWAEVEGGAPYIQTLVARSHSNGFSFVVGFLVYRWNQGEVQILRAVVADKYQNQQVGRQLIDSIHVRLLKKGPKRIFWTVLGPDEPARFLEACGFVRDAEHRCPSGSSIFVFQKEREPSKGKIPLSLQKRLAWEPP